MKHTKRLTSVLLILALTISLAFSPAYALDEKESVNWDLTFMFKDEAAFKAAVPKAEQMIKEMEALGKDFTTIPQVKKYFDKRSQTTSAISDMDCYSYLLAMENATSQTAAELESIKVQLVNSYTKVEVAALEVLKGKSVAFWDKMLADKSMAPYKNELSRYRKDMAKMPSAQVQQAISELSSAYNPVRLFEMITYSDMKFGKVTGSDGVTSVCDDNVFSFFAKEPKRELRLLANNTYMAPYVQFRHTLAENLYQLVKSKAISAKINNYDSSLEAALAGEGVPVAAYNAIIKGAEKALPIRHGSVAFKKDELGYDNLSTPDLYYPLVKDVLPTYTYSQAQDIIKKALAPLGKDYLAMLDRAFIENWIDLYPKENKAGGAFSLGTTTHAVVLMNYDGSFDSLATLAHELGHAVHQTMSEQKQENLYNGKVTVYTSEVASITNELLLLDYMKKNAKTDKERLALAEQEIIFYEGTFIRQCMYADFEKKMHDTVAKGGALTADVLGELWTSSQKKFYGPDYLVIDSDKAGWARIPHFYESFYVYKYATSVAYAAANLEGLISGDAKAINNYLSYLSSGDSCAPEELFKLIGIDITSPATVDALVDRYAAAVDEFKKLYTK